VDNLPISTPPIQQWLSVRVKQNGSYTADDNCMTVARQDFLDDAIRTGKCIFENRGAVARQGGPSATAISILALQSTATRKLIGEAAMVCAKDVHSEAGVLLQLLPRGRTLVDA
jgi:hypothetical protein